MSTRSSDVFPEHPLVERQAVVQRLERLRRPAFKPAVPQGGAHAWLRLRARFRSRRAFSLMEAFRVSLIVGAAIVFEGGDLLVEETVGAPAATLDIALEQLQANIAAHVLLAVVDGDLEHLALGAPPKPVVNQLRILRHERVLEMGHLTVEGDRLDRPVSPQHDRPPRRLVGTPALHADEPVLDNVEATDAIFPTQPVEFGQNLCRCHLLAVDGDDVALFVGGSR